MYIKKKFFLNDRLTVILLSLLYCNEQSKILSSGPRHVITFSAASNAVWPVKIIWNISKPYKIQIIMRIIWPFNFGFLFANSPLMKRTAIWAFCFNFAPFVLKKSNSWNTIHGTTIVKSLSIKISIFRVYKLDTLIVKIH